MNIVLATSTCIRTLKRPVRPRRQAGEDAPGISFLKEQQWSLDFGTALVKEQAVRESIRVPARLEARPGGAADVVAPIDGRLTGVVEVALGASVSRGQELARLLPPPSAPADLPQMQRALAEAQTALALATRDRERAERLTTAGAAPGRRLDEAQSAEEQAKARLTAAEASLAQYNAARTGGATDAAGLFIIRAPVSGVIAQREAATGANVTAGRVLFRVVDAAQVHVVGQVPEAQAARARLAQAAEIEIAGQPDRVPAGRLVSVGKVLDPRSRTLPITFAFDNRTLGLPVGQAAFLHLLMETTQRPPRRSRSSHRGRCRATDRVCAARGRNLRAAGGDARPEIGRRGADHRRPQARRTRGDERRLPRAPRVVVDVGSGPRARALAEASQLSAIRR